MHSLSALSGRVVIIGAGLAGIVAALKLERPCVVVSPTGLGSGAASMLAQGGIACALADGDSPELHAQDTLSAGAGLCDKDVVNAVTAAGPGAIAQLRRWGVHFAGTLGKPDLHLEAAHSCPRILHLNGDQSGAGIMRPLLDTAAECSRITILENTSLTQFCVENGALVGVQTTAGFIATTQCVVASGGVGGLFAGATCPAEASGSVLAQAVRVGAAVGDMEFAQFHPTGLAITVQGSRRPLISEAVRGAGAHLIDESGARFTEELQPRDIVARAIAAHRACGHEVFLDARSLSRGVFSEHFPGISAACKKAGIDPDRQPIPVEPAMHYHMGGLIVDLSGKTTVPGLWACGEAACTGLHGANRLASNSLLEAVVTAEWVANDINGQPPVKEVAPVVGRFSHDYGSVLPGLSVRLVRDVGILRDEDGLNAFLRDVAPHVKVSDAALVSLLIAAGALVRRESRGSHYRTDYPSVSDPIRRIFTLSDLQSFGVDIS
ncbi:L-aspartate oxidase [Neokomagataea tanensis]|uniref:L-aspartate oxidase n=2 Tax=Neokomagataea TaxID=1223423 RepID=A0A4Y6V754_9PROT|nr:MULTISPECIES: L-aspartate oxidase [Neokomagataea]QDH24688.1 L-aspartate oxidase [Neokomagataea tanensis]